jgi:hypothetical protein
MSVMTRYSLADRLALTAIKIDLHRLDAIDDLWTAYLESATPGEVASQRDELDQLSGQLIDALGSAQGSVERLRTMLEGTGEDEIESALQGVAQNHPEVEEAYRRDLVELLGEYSVRGVAIEACIYLEDQLPGEIAAVEEKRQRLLAGEFQPGDMSPGAKCALSGAMLGTKVLDIVMTGGAVSSVLEGAAGLGSFALKWRGGCGVIAGRIWTRLGGA